LMKPSLSSPSSPYRPPPLSSSSSVLLDPAYSLPSDIHLVKAMIAKSSKGHRSNNTNNNNNNNSFISPNQPKRLPPMPIREY
jgi:hypothetical protein